jgi:hypothetical protein
MTPSSGLNATDRARGWSLRSRWVDNTTFPSALSMRRASWVRLSAILKFIGGGKSLVGENIVMTAQWRIVSDPKRRSILPQPNQLPE